jgi:hypothetical protein
VRCAGCQPRAAGRSFNEDQNDWFCCFFQADLVPCRDDALGWRGHRPPPVRFSDQSTTPPASILGEPTQPTKAIVSGAIGLIAYCACTVAAVTSTKPRVLLSLTASGVFMAANMSAVFTHTGGYL